MARPAEALGAGSVVAKATSGERVVRRKPRANRATVPELLEELSRGDPDVAASVLQDFVEACQADVTALERLGPCAPATVDGDGGKGGRRPSNGGGRSR